MSKTKEPVRLRQRAMKSGLISLYLDIYQGGRRRYEYLKLYLYPEKSRQDKQRNKETLQLAETIRAKRLVEFRNGVFGFVNAAVTAKSTRVVEYIEELARQKSQGRKSVAQAWAEIAKKITAIGGQDVRFADIDAQFIERFKKNLDTAISARGRLLAQNSKLLYYTRLKILLNQAERDGIIRENPIKKMDNYKKADTERSYLTIDEVQRMAATPSSNAVLRRAFLFSCLTGLRISDIRQLTWGQIRQEGEFTRVVFRQQKTSAQEYIDISPQAAEYLGERAEPSDLVFNGMTQHTPTSELRRWAKEAGVDKPITFHSARHTFATMLLELGADLYTVSKLLGHREISTTQIYAKIVDKTKREAVTLIPKIEGKAHH